MGRGWDALRRSGGDLLSRVLRRSTIGATGLNGRVRDGIGCLPRAVTTGPAERILPSAGLPRFALLEAVRRSSGRAWSPAAFAGPSPWAFRLGRAGAEAGFHETVFPS